MSRSEVPSAPRSVHLHEGHMCFYWLKSGEFWYTDGWQFLQPAVRRIFWTFCISLGLLTLKSLRISPKSLWYWLQTLWPLFHRTSFHFITSSELHSCGGSVDDSIEEVRPSKESCFNETYKLGASSLWVGLPMWVLLGIAHSTFSVVRGDALTLGIAILKFDETSTSAAFCALWASFIVKFCHAPNSPVII